ncbi:acyloxyacyl hydrolase [Candidatus Aerophobetes bacterium]|nr:acyloxyacyl hydrolase [Candidatus Aerophobetes bacterium]
MKIIFKSYLVILCLFLSIPQKAFSFQRPESLKEIGVFAGSLRDGTLSEKDDYVTVPVGLRFGFDIKPLIKKFKVGDVFLKKESMLEFVAEPFIAGVISPDSNFETGCSLLLKYGYKFGKFLPFINAGTGLQYTTQHTREEATQWCFQVQTGAGSYYFFEKDKALSFEYRFRHFSNAGTKEPNKGVDTYGFYIGFSYFFN